MPPKEFTSEEVRIILQTKTRMQNRWVEAYIKANEEGVMYEGATSEDLLIGDFKVWVDLMIEEEEDARERRKSFYVDPEDEVPNGPLAGLDSTGKTEPDLA